jgi:molybdopterin-guanine dinucleotide biosynthesis protein A
MGRDKALVQLGDKPLIEHVLDRVQGLGDEILITTNQPEDYAYLGLRMASDREPGAGALAGLLTALEASTGDHTLLVACDMPFLQVELLQHLVRHRSQAQVVVPRRKGHFEPLLAIYAASVLPPVSRALAKGERRMISFFPEVKIHAVGEAQLAHLDPEGLSFFNVNTPEDLRQAHEILRSGDAARD